MPTPYKVKRRRLQRRRTMAALRARRLAAGECPECGKPKGQETQACDTCAEKDRKRMRVKQEEMA